MHRQTPDAAVLVSDGPSFTGNSLLNAADFDFDFEAGYELSAIRHNVFGSCWDIEGRFFEIDDWSSSVGPISSPNGVSFGYFSPNDSIAVPASVVLGTYTSELQNVEVNARRDVTNNVQMLFGFRYLELDEGLTLTQAILGPANNVATHAIGAATKMYGFQLGADAVIPVGPRLSLEAVAKAGVYGANMENGVLITQTLVPDVFASAATGNNTAFLGELGFTAQYQVTCRLSVRASYQLMWLEGVAVASDQIAVSDPVNGIATVDTGGSLFYHGAFIGLQVDL
jgi:hypothetical protein